MPTTASEYIAMGLTTPEQVQRHREWMDAQRTAERVAINHYRIQLAGFIARLHNTWPHI
jgi:hypothetical protein